jgi:hypothetical protein
MDNEITASEMPAPAAVPVASNSWIERLVQVLLSPTAAFTQIRDENAESMNGLAGAMLIVLLVFGLDGVRAAGTVSAESIAWTLCGSVLFGFLFWLSLAGLIWVASMCFGGSKQDSRAAFVSLGWSFAPWLFMPPLFCYQHAMGSFFSVMAIIPGTWMFVLELIAIRTSFRLKWWKTLLLAFIAPALLSTYQVLQFCQSVYVSMSSMN